ncbi:hypothetical protein V2J09_014880 [Rumex salicifolius]
MSSAQDPFYIVKEEIQDSDYYIVGQIVLRKIDKLLSTFNEWETLAPDTGKKVQLTKALLTGCESIQWQVDELDKAVSVAARDPAFYGINDAELEKRRKWTKNARDKVGTVRMAVGKGRGYQDASNTNGSHHEMMRFPVGDSRQKAASSEYDHDNDDFVSSESDRQMLLMKQQDQELDELSASVQRIGHVGLTIHDELIEQERIMDDLGAEIDSTSNRLDFLQKKVAFVMKKAGVKGQLMIILFLLVLFIILFVLVCMVSKLHDSRSRDHQPTQTTRHELPCKQVAITCLLTIIVTPIASPQPPKKLGGDVASLEDRGVGPAPRRPVGPRYAPVCVPRAETDPDECRQIVLVGEAFGEAEEREVSGVGDDEGC